MRLVIKELKRIKKLKKMRGVKGMRLIGVYLDNEDELLVNLVNTIEEGALWIGVSPQALYKNHKIHGVMGANGFKLEIINIEEDDDNEL